MFQHNKYIYTYGNISILILRWSTKERKGLGFTEYQGQVPGVLQLHLQMHGVRCITHDGIGVPASAEAQKSAKAQRRKGAGGTEAQRG
jgi:hypothetical protein